MSSGGDHRPQHGYDAFGDVLFAVASVERTEVAAEAHGGDRVPIDVGGDRAGGLEVREEVLDECDAWFDSVCSQHCEQFRGVDHLAGEVAHQHHGIWIE